LSQTVTTGIISGLRGGGTNIAQKLQHDAPINPGNSGGPLVNLDGEIIGVNNSIRSAADKGNNGIGFAIPSNIVKQLLPSLLAGGSGPPPQQQAPAQPAAPRAYLGVELSEFEDGDPQKAQIPGGNGIVIVAVAPDTPADKGGLKDGDIILRYNNIVADSVEKLVAHIGGSKPGASLTLLIFRDGKSLTFTITLGERK
jgi:S1-C subfamily serine protease